jgi:polysaccharide export outer membrane protein
MKHICAVLLSLAGFLFQPMITVQGQVAEAATAATTDMADGKRSPNERSPALTGVRRPLYRLQKSDVVEIRFTLSPEFDQTIPIQPDGYISLRAAGNLFAEGLTVNELLESVKQAYQPILHDPEVTVVLKDFEKPSFIAAGQVGRPGRYELRSTTGVAEAIAIAGGFTEQAKHSQVVLFRKITDGVVETHVLNLKAMLASRNLEEDLELRPGDMLFVPQNRISKIRKYLPTSSLSTFVTPTQF